MLIGLKTNWLTWTCSEENFNICEELRGGRKWIKGLTDRVQRSNETTLTYRQSQWTFVAVFACVNASLHVECIL